MKITAEKVTVDTNVLVRAAVRDDASQARAAAKLLKGASVLVVTLPCLCEFVWVLSKAYRFHRTAISAAIRVLLSADNVETNRAAVEAGLAMLETGGDFADAVIAHEGALLGGDTFVSFDKAAVDLLKARGHETYLLS